MAALAKSHEINLVVRTAVCQRQDVMHFLGGSESAFILAVLTQRMLQQKSRSDLLPRAAVSFVGVRVAKVLVILTLSDLPVPVTVPTVGQPSAARIGAGTLGFVRHFIPPKESKRASAFGAKALNPSFAIVLSHKWQSVFQCLFLSIFKGTRFQRLIMKLVHIPKIVSQFRSYIFPTFKA